MRSFINVNGAPFLLLAGEVHNSNASSLEGMEPIWEKAKQLALNTVLLPITWELLEPEEGEFDFSLTDGLIRQARAHGMRIGFLWFGAWKNAQCFYAPHWVKRNLGRFRRAEVEKGKNKTNLEAFHGIPYTTLSCHCEETLKADSRAFAMLMRHIREVDGQERTVVLMQVENECGLQGAAREHSKEADALFAGEVPEAFAAYMRSHLATMAEDIREAVETGKASGSWEEVFGPAAEEIFYAYSVSGYVEAVAAAGRREYDLPMIANAWLDKGEKPGVFPSGGPVARMMEVWRYRAPHIDIFAPDIYVRDFCRVCDEYTKMGNPLLIPETVIHGHTGPRLVYVIGHYHALGYAPFGFEDMGEPFSATDSYLFGADTTDPLLQIPQDREEYAWYNRTLQSMMPLLTVRYGTGDLQAVISERPQEDSMVFEKFTFRALMDLPMMARKDGVCLALQLKEDEFCLLANACFLAMSSTDSRKPNVDILALEEGEFRDGQWHRHRRLNGDEAMAMRFEKPTLLKVKLLAYE